MLEPSKRAIFGADNPGKRLNGDVYHLRKPNKWRQIIFSLAKQAALTLLIFAVLFVIMNWGAISQILSWEIEKATTDVVKNNVLHDFAKKEKPKEQKPLPIQTNPVLSKKDIPELVVTVSPPDTRIIIPRINKNVPIIPVKTENLIKREWGALEKDMQKALQYGVINYPGTARPGQPGNIVLTGHSSYFPWDPGRFKDVFALLHDIVLDDKIILFHKEKKYIYKVNKIYEVKPSDLKVLQQTPDNRLTLITCTPIGTNLRRLIVEARLMDIEN